MGLEEEIKTTGFKDEWHKVTVNVVYTSNWLWTKLEKRAAKRNITLQQFNVLRILRGQYPNPATNFLIKERLITNTPDISRLIDRIVQKGFVIKTKNIQDRRASNLLITDSGLQLLQEMEHEMMMYDLLKDKLSEKEAAQLNSLLDKLRE